MKKYILTTLFFFTAILVFAQEETETTDKVRFNHEIGLNTSFFQNIIANNGSNRNPYSLSYKLIFNNLAIRIGGGGTYDRERIQEDGFADNQLFEAYTTDLRLGFEGRKSFDNSRWLLTYGIDAIGYQRVDKLIQDSGFDKVTEINQSFGYGGGLTAGLQFYINDHLSISTEGSFYFYNQENTIARLFENFPDFDDVLNTSTSAGFINQLPTSVYLIYRF